MQNIAFVHEAVSHLKKKGNIGWLLVRIAKSPQRGGFNQYPQFIRIAIITKMIQTALYSRKIAIAQVLKV